MLTWFFALGAAVLIAAIKDVAGLSWLQFLCGVGVLFVLGCAVIAFCHQEELVECDWCHNTLPRRGMGTVRINEHRFVERCIACRYRP